MTNRRVVLQGAAALSTLPLVARLSSSLARTEQPGTEQAGTKQSPAANAAAMRCEAVYDTRFEPSVAFARRLESCGVSLHAMAGDMTDLWFGSLHQRWQTEPTAIVGLTAHGPLFCLERLGWDHGLRLTYRAQHLQSPSGRWEHHLNGPRSLDGEIQALARSADWAPGIADLMLRALARSSAPLPEIFVGSRQGAALEEDGSAAEPLYTWILAPRKRA